MAVNAKIITNVKDNVLLVPSTAVQTTNGQSTVRILKNGQLQTVAVTTGDSNDTDTEIMSGLSEGDTVVTSIVTQSTGSRATSSPFSGGFGGGNRVFFNGGGGGRAATGRGG
jgi:multidrug efflux pump subunit AcrA (membrane-fusion protein)